MAEADFDYMLADSQGTPAHPIDPSEFDFVRFKEYEGLILENSESFWRAESGVAVHRRMRVPKVFSYGCRNMKESLALQLGALEESMKYRMDVPNYLEPWYGIGTIAASFGARYVWNDNQAPATKAMFRTIQEALAYDHQPVERTAIGKAILEMTEYFLEETRGELPISLTDTQSPFNTASYLIDSNSFYMALLDDPDSLRELLSIITDRLIDFSRKQMQLLGTALVMPGHGFTSCRMFAGVGMSDDNMIAISPSQYRAIEVPFIEKVGHEFGGVAIHSCGNWSGKINAVRSVQMLSMVDGAFSGKTDPDPNPTKPFAEGLVNTGVVLNARIVGDEEIILDVVRGLWAPGMKMIVVTYLQDPGAQERVYQKVQEICT